MTNPTAEVKATCLANQEQQQRDADLREQRDMFGRFDNPERVGAGNDSRRDECDAQRLLQQKPDAADSAGQCQHSSDFGEGEASSNIADARDTSLSGELAVASYPVQGAVRVQASWQDVVPPAADCAAPRVLIFVLVRYHRCTRRFSSR